MNSSFTQTIEVTTTPSVGVPDTGFIATSGSGGGTWLLIVTMVLLLVAIAAVIWYRHRHHHGQTTRVILSTLAIAFVGIIFGYFALHATSANAESSLAVTPANQSITLRQGQTVTISPVATINAASALGYQLSLVESQASQYISASISGGGLAKATSVTTSPVIVEDTSAAAKAGGDQIATTLTITAASDAPVGKSTLQLVYSLAEKVPTTMQSLTTSYCKNNMTTYDGTNPSAILTLTDPRGDGASYQVAKLADGNCWMLNNLRLGSTTSSITLTPSDSDVTSNFTLPKLNDGTRTLDASTNPGNDYDTPYAYGPVPGDTGSGITDYGYLYNWNVATAGETRTSIPGDGTNNDTAPYSICPAGWKLPTANDATSDFAKLDIAWGGNGTYSATDPAAPNFQADGAFHGVLSGFWYGGFAVQGTNGGWWSSSAYPGNPSGADSAYVVGAQVYPSGLFNRDVGLSLRCLL